MVTPGQLLAEAQKLLVSATNELDYRRIIQDAYYAAFHSANELEKSFPARSSHRRSGVGDHESLFLLLEHPNPNLDYAVAVISRDVATQLRILRPFRKLATYYIDKSVAIADVEQALAAAEDVVKECAEGKRRVTALVSENKPSAAM